MAGKRAQKQEYMMGVIPTGHNLLYITGLICMILGLFVFIFTVYSIPSLIFDFDYPLPDFITNLSDWIQKNGTHGLLLLVPSIVGPPLIFSVVMFYIASAVTRRLDTDIVERQTDHVGEELPEEEPELLPKEAGHLAAKIIFGVIVLISALVFFEIFMFHTT
jgi:hypothetical protein